MPSKILRKHGTHLLSSVFERSKSFSWLPPTNYLIALPRSVMRPEEKQGCWSISPAEAQCVSRPSARVSGSDPGCAPWHTELHESVAQTAGELLAVKQDHRGRGGGSRPLSHPTRDHSPSTGPGWTPLSSTAAIPDNWVCRHSKGRRTR